MTTKMNLTTGFFLTVMIKMREIVMFLDQNLIPHSLEIHLFLKGSVALEQEELDV
jgi:hypothetical protein